MDTLNAAIAKTTLPVEDLARAKAFYAEKLGLRPAREVEGTLFYEADGDTGFLLFLSGGRASGQHTQMAWFVKDIVYTVAKRKSSGVPCGVCDCPGLTSNHGTADLGYEKAAWFHDSEGTLLALGQLA